MFVSRNRPAPPDRPLLLRRAQIHRGEEQRTRAQHDKGKLTARERVDLLLDDSSFQELGIFRRGASSSFGPGQTDSTDGVITGWGQIHGRDVVVSVTDFRVIGGTLGTAHANKVERAMELALKSRVPYICINDGGGARIQEGALSLDGYARIFRLHVAMSGVVPQLSVILGPCAGGAAYSPALTDFTFVVAGISQMYLTGPSVVRAVTGEDLTGEELGGASVHSTTSGVGNFYFDSEADCLNDVRYLVTILPAASCQQIPEWSTDDSTGRRCERIDEIVPTDSRRGYDVREVVSDVVDYDSEPMEVNAAWAPNLVTMFGHVNGCLVGFVCNQPSVRAGVLDVDASDKAARFVQFCDAFRIPLVTLVDVPGFLPGCEQEKLGVIRHGAKLLFAYGNATVPRIQVIMRKAYGGAYIVMDSRSLGSDISLAWPGNEIAVMGADGAVEVVYRRRIGEAEDPIDERQACIKEYRAEFMHPFYGAERGLVDELIEPTETRMALAGSLRLLARKEGAAARPRHGNPPQ